MEKETLFELQKVENEWLVKGSYQGLISVRGLLNSYWVCLLYMIEISWCIHVDHLHMLFKPLHYDQYVYTHSHTIYI